MQLTNEQQNIVDTDCNMVINAVAGSGKTSTLIAYAKSRPPGKKILYLAFNKTVKTEALQKFAKAEVQDVRVETAHSLAYDFIVKERVRADCGVYERCVLENGSRRNWDHTRFLFEEISIE